MMKLLTVIVLTYNEAKHISRCLASCSRLDARLVVVDSFSGDDTCDLAQTKGAEVYQNPFVSQAQQFEWAMENCGIETEWILRLDADETIDDELCESVARFLKASNTNVNGAVFLRKHIFLGKWVRHGGRYPLPMLRLFRKGTAHIEQRWMDEHIVLDAGSSVVLKGGFEDNNLNSIGWFIDKHNKYATREVLDIKLAEIFPVQDKEISKETGLGIWLKRQIKEGLYLRLPYFIRPTLYFLYRYIIQLGFLDGARGFAYHFMQGFWYRALVDLKCLEVDRLWANATTVDQKLSLLEAYSGYDLSSYRVPEKDAA